MRRERGGGGPSRFWRLFFSSSSSLASKEKKKRWWCSRRGVGCCGVVGGVACVVVVVAWWQQLIFVGFSSSKSRERTTFFVSEGAASGVGAKEKTRKGEHHPPRRALTITEDAETSANGFRVDTFNLDETFQRRVSWKELDASSFFPPPPLSMLDDDTNASETVQLEEEEEEEEEQKQFLAKLLDAFAKQNSALYDAKMKAFSSLPSDAFVASANPLQRLQRVETCEPRCGGEFRRTGGFGLLPQFFSNEADPNWNSFENRVNAARENAGEFLEHFVEFYVQDEDEEDDTRRSVLMKTALNIFSGLVTAKDDRSLYNAMNNNVRLLGDERDMIRKSMLMGKEM